MALTQAQWYEKLKGFVPTWYFESENFQRAHFQALAKMLADVQTGIDEAIAQTHILQASTPYLQLHGYERSVEQLLDEPDSVYAVRVQRLANSSFKAAIKSLVDGLLLVGTCDIREWFAADNCYASRGSYLSRNEFLNDRHYNVFTIVIDKQIPPPRAFASHGYYASRGAYAGSDLSNNTILESIVAAVDAAKAFGVLYKIVERH